MIEDFLKDKFLAGIIKTDTCWLWGGHIARSGYGKITRLGTAHYTHRLAHTLFVGPIPEGFEVDHLCRVPACCNPEHLEAVPPHVNNARSSSPSSLNARKTHCPKGHVYSPENTYRQPTGGRICRTCHREWQAGYHNRKKLAAVTEGRADG